MWIKICANTNLDDAQLAAELGADAVGFVFASSPRQVTAAEVARITPHLPESLECVGVFPALEAQEIAGIAQECGLTAVQLQGGVNLELLRQLDDIFNGQVKLIQTIHWQVDADAANAGVVVEQLRQIDTDGLAARVLIDAKVGSALGGTGISFDWDAAGATLAEARVAVKLIVAGGLRPENVADAIRRLNPWGVDVASGVEQSPGRKSPERLAAFIRAARDTAR
ncbi:MAG: Phosphoribosylanthranilate isomerase [Edaphobacter sp.]|jgi:phosphoribosylanthranilate isomerase|nr:Phosphoribosylanthranilate isomerase [Edaphobacter sp.]